MAEESGFSGYRPSKTMWFWSCVGCVVATLIIGFTWGGWVTQGSAADSALKARDSGRAELAAAICVDRFINAPDVQVQLAALKEASSWNRDKLITEGGWSTPVGVAEPIDGAADLCADQLAAMDLPVEAAAVDGAVVTPAVEAN